MDKQRENLKNLKDRTPEERKEIAKKGGIKSGEVRRKKKLMSEIYAHFLESEHKIIDKHGKEGKLSGAEICNAIMSKVLNRGDSSSVRLMKEIREGTEGKKIKLDGLIEFKTIPASQVKVEDLDESTNRK